MAEDPGASPPVSDGEQRHIFPFFKLARELRDAIYDECVQETRVDGPGYQPEIRAEGIVVPHLLLVNHQFAAEYASRAQNSGVVTVSDLSYSLPRPLQLPAFLCKHPLRIEVNTWCPWLGLIDGHWDWIGSFLSQVCTPRGFSVRVITRGGMNVGELLAELNAKPWASIPNFTGFQVYQDWATDGPLSTMWQQLSLMKHVGGWSKSSGKIEDVQGTESELESDEDSA
ncbi:hypothetical protein M409DRAFT_25509 [Zasmidium cellare ATCC 36951]|uniref:Uncharacterized protein n=1 Tax=Zasmidium cellare ATCC 36951 TaxID=1080233 RepID=A0A6A6CBJ5_ZASCE|nr:uncharacterized protein M409DRAFT_25509 [Zasmidium cellare ATCC 36951]KAF2164163.1 hypothetical protein M409DRAFT_25509 [Zasmidium cellare ATCC 36951]